MCEVLFEANLFNFIVDMINWMMLLFRKRLSQCCIVWQLLGLVTFSFFFNFPKFVHYSFNICWVDFLRLVNGAVEKTRKKEEVSIGGAAEAIGIPRMLIDIRHGKKS